MPSSRFTVIPEVHSAADPAAARIRVPFVRPALPSWESFGPAAAEILASGRLTKGTFVERLEQAIARGWVFAMRSLSAVARSA